MEIILKSDDLDCAEDNVCEFSFQWITARCIEKGLEPNGKNLREVANNLLILVRFPVVDMKYFSNNVVKTGILTSDETISVYQSQFTEDNENVLHVQRNQKCPVKK